MTAQEIDRIQNAIRHIQTAVDVDPWAVEIAVNAMQKQIPKKYVRDGITNKCPSCDLKYMLVRSIHGDGSYCTKCGQRIDMRGET